MSEELLPRFEEERAFQLLLSGKEALALIGPRRIGKSSLAKMLLARWKKLPGKEGAYYEFESLSSERDAKAFVRLMEGQVPAGGLVVLDEVQSLPEWSRVVRGQVEEGRRKVIVTGSSSAMLSVEISTILAGRSMPVKVLPLSYGNARAWGRINTLDEYLAVGGYPEAAMRPGNALELHRAYFEVAILRDVAVRQRITRKIGALKDLATLLLSEPGKKISSSRIAAQLGITQPTLGKMIRGLSEAFLVLRVHPFSRSPRRRIFSGCKYYAYDTGLQRSVSLSASEDSGRRLENLVAIELVRRGYEIYYIACRGSECDFLAERPGAPRLAVQVWSGEGAVPPRELVGLSAGMRESRTAEGLLLTKTRDAELSGPLPQGARISSVEDWLLVGKEP